MRKFACLFFLLHIGWSVCKAQNCNNWLSTPSVSSSVNIGKLDIPGNQVTVEATINRTQPYVPGGGDNTEGDIVSKHNDFSDVNYLLRPNHAYITTTNGFFGTPDICDLTLNKTYHVALVYDGSTLKFYRDGFLMSQVAASGNLIQNNWDTRIGHYSQAFYTTQFIGYINEVRIWNVARTQAQLQSYMNTSLPAPTAQTGLLAYYQFNNLVNKQGNTTFNGTINGAATINTTNTSCAFVADSCARVTTACNNWLATPATPSYANMGQVNITGNKITVEATFNRTTSYSGGEIYAGDLVSKHNDPSDANYLLRPNTAEITTSNGYFRTPDICDIELNKTYHAAMVYDGSTLKFYRNGFLMSQVAATGTLYQNNWQTRIGWYEPQGFNTNFIGYINEVRIWNVAKTQAELKNYMNTTLPAPTTQPGLVAYYTFDNLLNKQGNTAFDGVLGGSASINATNPNCAFVADSCAKIISDSLIINTYTPVIAFNPCENKITVEDASTFNIGDTVLMIQMKGALIDTSNTAAFGNITNFKNAGNYEYNYVKSKSGNIIELTNVLLRQYDLPDGRVQLVRVPYYKSITFSSPLTCLPWDGKKGGVLVFNVKDTIKLNSDIDVSGKGFKGGREENFNTASTNCSQNDFYYMLGNVFGAAKGEGIAEVSTEKSAGKGKLANGGGGGNDHNAGGGGGSNASIGGRGGNQFNLCNDAIVVNAGVAGYGLTNYTTQNKIYLGGGGGSGHANDPGADPFTSGGGRGGALILISSGYLQSNSSKIKSNGNNGTACTGSNCNEGAGGGGAGGSILLNTNNFLDKITVEAKGGNGASTGPFPTFITGPGGGGSGGVIWFKQNVNPPGALLTLNGGINGVNTTAGNDAWGALPGSAGFTYNSLVLPVTSVPFKKNIDSVKIKSAKSSCNSFDFTGLAYVQNSAIKTWHWDFGDGTTASSSVVTHPYATVGAHTVSLVVTDNNGCTDSVKTTVTTTGSTIDFSYNQNSCNPLSIQFSAIGNAPVNPSWIFGDGGLATGATPTHVYANTGNYLVKYTAQTGSCNDTITKNISVNILRQDIILTRDTTICFGTTKQLLTAPSLNFCWSPTTYLDDPLSANPTTNTPVAITYFLTAQIPGVNTIVNGDFSAGNTGFASAYNFATPNITEAQYFVGTNPQNWNGGLSPCGDHTTGSGNMMLVNGAPTADVLVWSESVAVTPNTNYAFSTWIQALYTPNPAQLSFSINGGDVGTLITASLPTCSWTQFYTTWNSGNNTSAKIAIVNKNTFVQGNDFALDDISFAPVLIKRDSVIITVDNPSVKANNDTLVCAGKAVQLSANGSISYNWSPTTGLSNATVANPVATPAVNTQYIVTGTDSKGCTATDTVSITAKTLPVVAVTPGTAICKNTPLQLQASGGSTYQWLPVAGLSNAAIANPVASPVTTTTYVVVVTGVNSCTATDSVKIAVNPDPVFTISAADTTCLNASAQLLATGGDVYTWSPAALVNNPNIANPTTNASSNTTYTVVIKELTCNTTATLTTSVAVLPVPAIKATKLNDIDCSISAAQLQATGSGPFSWSPAASLDNSTAANPLASPNATTLYTVSAVDLTTNCVATDTITVVVNKIGSTSFFIPSAFTPNGDGLNDCFKVSHFTFMKSVEVSIFNRYGSMVFHTTTDNDCWNGTYQGKAADAGNYVYYIKAEDNCSKFYKKGNLVLIR
ncbi:PKD domain-containing protein [Ferruginibacter paludis]|uniref:LamG-like jellyroll fold domain-containing protein n=1 Tax=Ferruginibacter paludis TaxID=1310417 RepID=UPI0025B58F2A|nr:LamG-like jellyroll fold domain-containing protein [Ferruginibacter paludis]MDN3657170.1 PKD domain-containing protein [Ferruginibacter paludis]